MNTKRIESGHFKYFRQLLPNFPPGEVWHEDEPDFLVNTENGILGIEHRQLFKSQRELRSPLQAMESQIDDIVALAQEHAELRGTPPAHVSLFFDISHSLAKKHRLTLARQLANFIHENLPPKNDSVRLELGARYQGEMPEAVDLAIVTRNEHRNRHHWDSSEAGWAVKDSRDILQAAINDKASNIERYLNHCSSCWLLLASDGLKPSNFIHADEASREHTYSSPFERTYFLDCAYGDLVLLNAETP